MNNRFEVIAVTKRHLLTADILVWGLAFTIPLVLSHPQPLVGTIVNSLLVITARRMPIRSWLPIAILPSLGVIMHGVLFGSLTMFLIYFLPIIWLGNLIYMKVISFKSPAYAANVMFGAALKAGLLFLGANLYLSLGLVPTLFLTAMGINQLLTALSGGVVAWLALLILKENHG